MVDECPPQDQAPVLRYVQGSDGPMRFYGWFTHLLNTTTGFEEIVEETKVLVAIEAAVLDPLNPIN